MVQCDYRTEIDVERSSYNLSVSTGVQARLNCSYTLTIHCDTGYAVSQGDALRTCLPSGLFSGVKPFCGGKSGF